MTTEKPKEEKTKIEKVIEQGVKSVEFKDIKTDFMGLDNLIKAQRIAKKSKFKWFGKSPRYDSGIDK